VKDHSIIIVIQPTIGKMKFCGIGHLRPRQQIVWYEEYCCTLLEKIALSGIGKLPSYEHRLTN
jgi:hypothetical protein